MVQLDSREQALSWKLCFESSWSSWKERKSLAIMRITQHAKRKQLPRDRDRQKKERFQANKELKAGGREETQSQLSRNGGKKDSSSGYVGSCAEFTASGKSLGVKSNPKEE